MERRVYLGCLWTIFGVCLAVYSLAGQAMGLSPAGGKAVGRSGGFASPSRSLLIPAKIVGSDDRMTYQDFAQSKNVDLAEFYAQFEAVGELECPHLAVSAQLVETSNLVLTAGHIFYDNSCEAVDVSKCVFRLKKGNNIIERKIKSGSIETGRCEPGERRNDWAFFVLEESITEVRPFLVPTQPPMLKGGDSILQATWSAANYKAPTQDQRHIQNCTIKVVDPSSDAAPMETDCDTGEGSSGSAQMMASPAGFVVVAINNSQFVNGKDGDKYQISHFGNVSAPLTGELFTRLWERINSLSTENTAATAADGHEGSLDLEFEAN